MKIETEETWKEILKIRMGLTARFPSKIFKNLLYWNTTNCEFGSGFPTIYFKNPNKRKMRR